jgi:hypothetical protein
MVADRKDLLADFVADNCVGIFTSSARAKIAADSAFLSVRGDENRFRPDNRSERRN